MTLKECYAYQNFLAGKISIFSDIISDPNYIYTTETTLLHSQVDPSRADEIKQAINTKTYNVTAEGALKALMKLYIERNTCAKAIALAKASLPEDIDTVISCNKDRRALLSSLSKAANLTAFKREMINYGTRINNEGAQVEYKVPSVVSYTPALNIKEVRETYDTEFELAERESSWVDRMTVTTDVAFIPAFKMSDSVMDIYDKTLAEEDNDTNVRA